MRILLLILLLIPAFSFSQPGMDQKLHFKTTVVTDSGTIKGYFLYTADSVIILSPEKRYFYNSTSTRVIPVNSIKEINIRKKGEYRALGIIGSAILGFTLAAGLTQNKDIDNDGKTSFFELIWGAIEGTTSRNRQRRNSALLVGAAGGTLFTVVSLVANRHFSLSFPIKERNNFYSGKKYDIREFLRF